MIKIVETNENNKTITETSKSEIECLTKLYKDGIERLNNNPRTKTLEQIMKECES